MSLENQEFSVREVLLFLHDALRFMRYGSLDTNWIHKEPSDLSACAASFRAQPVVRLVGNVVKNTENREIGDVIKILQQSLQLKLEMLADQGLLDQLSPWIGTIVTENRASFARLWTDASKPNEVKSPSERNDAESENKIREVQPMSKVYTTEVVIHVVDDVRGGSKDFTLPASILLEKMPYFAKATRGQILSDVDITVHCDVHIFEWLTRWMSLVPPPSIEPVNVVPILLSAAFLETETLVEECLNFCHDYTNQILDAKQSFSCLSDQLVEKLAAKFTATEVELLGHQRSSLQSRLYGCFIAELCSAKTSPERGIFRNASTLFQCSYCNNMLTEDVQQNVPCSPGRIVLTTTGQLVHRHQRNESWNITEHVQSLKCTLKTWRRVYWRLWATTHFLHCSTCGLHFAALDYLKCQYHPETGLFNGATRSKGNFQPIGRYPCCQQPAFRFSAVSGPEGCKTKEHIVSYENAEQLQIMAICRQFSDLIHVVNQPKSAGSTGSPLSATSSPPAIADPLKLTRPSDEEEIIPRFTLGLSSRPRKHLVQLPWQPYQGIHKETNRPKTACSSQDSLSTVSGESDDKCRKSVNVLDHHPGAVCYEEDEDMQEDEVEVDPSSPVASKALLAAGRDAAKKLGYPAVAGVRRKFSSRRENKQKPQPTVKEVDLRWNSCLSSRTNQDAQRYMEEEIFRRIITILTPPEWQKARSPAGGLFAKIHRILQEKAQREARQAKLASTARSISSIGHIALAARKFKAQLSPG